MTYQITVTTTPATITAQSACTKVRVTENCRVNGYPTSQFLTSKPGSGANTNAFNLGAQYTFESDSRYSIGEPVGSIALPPGANSTTFDVDEINS